MSEPNDEKPDSYVLVGEGAGCIENWYEGFDVFDDIVDCIENSMKRDIELDWPSIFSQIEGLQHLAQKGLQPEGQADFLEALDMLPGAAVEREGWDSDAPGMSGVWYEVHISKTKSRMSGPRLITF